MVRLRQYVERKRSALFVASGDSNAYVRQWLPHFDAVAVHQQALLAVPGPVDYAAFYYHEVADICRHEFHRVRCFVCSEPLSGNAHQDDTREIAETCLPLDRCVTFPRHWQACTRDADGWIATMHDTLWQAWGSAAMIHFLAMVGYQWVFCLGHSFADGTVSPTYRDCRAACECAADAVAARYGTRVAFWYPGASPNTWRTDERRGFLYAR